jgi:hypothetical protein
VVYAYGAERPFDTDRRFYDCFEKVPGGNAEWRVCAFGLESARAKLNLALRTPNEVFMIELYEDKVIERQNVPGRPKP